MPRLPHRRLDECPAHTDVTIGRADDLWWSNNVDYPVSGDESLREVGRTLVRRAHRGNRLWQQPGVIPRTATTGIRVGDTITAYDDWGDKRSGTVTAVGTVAGWARTGAQEWLWSVDCVTDWPRPDAWPRPAEDTTP